MTSAQKLVSSTNIEDILLGLTIIAKTDFKKGSELSLMDSSYYSLEEYPLEPEVARIVPGGIMFKGFILWLGNKNVNCTYSQDKGFDMLRNHCENGIDNFSIFQL